jgi:hypothetical protein
MKKAKMMLVGVSMLAVVGGAFAFKASKSTGTFVCATEEGVAATTSVRYTPNASGSLCFTIPYAVYTITPTVKATQGSEKVVLDQ